MSATTFASRLRYATLEFVWSARASAAAPASAMELRARSSRASCVMVFRYSAMMMAW